VNIALFVEAQTENIHCFSTRPVNPSIINGDGVKFYVQYYYIICLAMMAMWMLLKILNYCPSLTGSPCYKHTRHSVFECADSSSLPQVLVLCLG